MASLSSWRLYSPAFSIKKCGIMKSHLSVGLVLSTKGCNRVRGLTARCMGTSIDSCDEQQDVILKCISRTAEVSVLSISATHLVQEAQRRHQLAPTALSALGRALMGTLLLGTIKDDSESVQLTFSGDGPLGKMITVATRDCWVKGFVENPLCDLPPKANKKLNVGGAVGSGMLNVSRHHPLWKQPYIGTVPIFSGEVAEDIAHYLANSEQVNTAIGLGVTLNKNGTVKSAYGFLVQVLPFCSEETIIKLEESIQKMPPLSDGEKETSAKEILESILQDVGMGEMYSVAEPKYGPCEVTELKQRMMRAVVSLGKSDLEKLLSERGNVEVRCEFCAEEVQFQREDLQHILEESVQGL